MRFKVTVAYDGSLYQGYQTQPNASSIQQAIESALAIISSETITIVASGRTDKGVHALGQVFHFDTLNNMDEMAWYRALNTYLPKDIECLKVEVVSDTFHARFDVIKKTYLYVIAKDYNLFERFHESYITYPLNIDSMRTGLDYLKGTHDFKGFGVYVANKPTIRTMYEVKLTETDTHYIFEFTADGFLKYMVRSIMGTLIDIGRGHKKSEVIQEILETQNRHLVGKTADPAGLYLKEVLYE